MRSFKAGGDLVGMIDLIQTAIVGIALVVSLVLVARLGSGTLPRKVWSSITIALVLMLAVFSLETVNSFADREVISETAGMILYALVFIPILAALFQVYFGYRRAGYEFKQ